MHSSSAVIKFRTFVLVTGSRSDLVTGVPKPYTVSGSQYYSLTTGSIMPL